MNFFSNYLGKLDLKNSIFKESEEEILERSLSMLPEEVHKNLNSKGYYLIHDQKSVPYENLEFPTPNNKIQALGPHFKFGESKLKQIINRKKNEFMLISPSHFHLLHSQLGQLNSKHLPDFDRVFLNKEDIIRLDLNVGDIVLVSNEYGSATYILSELKSLKPGVALIFSGASSPSNDNINVNFFTPDIPEELGLSGGYYSVLIRIEKT